MDTLDTFAQQLAASRVIPVVTAYSTELTVALAGALAAGGMRSIEVTLRTDCALESIRAVKSQFPQLYVIAGTVTGPAHLDQAMTAGADACVSPGISAELLAAARESATPFLPGVATASEVMLGLQYEQRIFKCFPAEAIGGAALIKSLSGPYPDVQFCPTGGLTSENFRQYLELSNVICCGGSWMTGESMIRAGDWDAIERLSREALQ